MKKDLGYYLNKLSSQKLYKPYNTYGAYKTPKTNNMPSNCEGTVK